MNEKLADLAPGTEEKPWAIGRVDVADFVRYAGASGDFNRIHYDAARAALSGAPTVFGQGMFSAGLLASYLSAWVAREHIRRLRFRFVDRLWPEDFLTAKGHCIAVSHSDDWLHADLEASLVADGGAIKALATCELRAPRPRG